MKRFAGLLVSFILLTLIPALVNAQSGTCDGGFDPGCSPDDPCPCPIDNGLLVLILLAIGLTAFRAYSLRKRKALSQKFS